MPKDKNFYHPSGSWAVVINQLYGIPLVLGPYDDSAQALQAARLHVAKTPPREGDRIVKMLISVPDLLGEDPTVPAPYSFDREHTIAVVRMNR